jgi:hypothetical protein
MKSRHAAALALVGWYLMLPPTHGGFLHFYTDEPLNKWCQGNYSETLVECKQGQQQRIRELIAAGQKEPQRLKDASYWTKGQCVAEDDPRLRPK